MTAGTAIGVNRIGRVSCWRKSGAVLNRIENGAVEVKERVLAGSRRGDNS